MTTMNTTKINIASTSSRLVTFGRIKSLKKKFTGRGVHAGVILITSEGGGELEGKEVYFLSKDSCYQDLRVNDEVEVEYKVTSDPRYPGELEAKRVARRGRRSSSTSSKFSVKRTATAVSGGAKTQPGKEWVTYLFADGVISSLKARGRGGMIFVRAGHAGVPLTIHFTVKEVYTGYALRDSVRVKYVAGKHGCFAVWVKQKAVAPRVISAATPMSAPTEPVAPEPVKVSATTTISVSGASSLESLVLILVLFSAVLVKVAKLVLS